MSAQTISMICIDICIITSKWLSFTIYHNISDNHNFNHNKISLWTTETFIPRSLVLDWFHMNVLNQIALKETVKHYRVLRIPQWILFSAIWNWPQEIYLINCQKIKKWQNIIYTPFLSHEWIWQSYISICKLSLLIISIRVHLNLLMSMIMGQYILHMGAIMRKSIIVSSNLDISNLNWCLTTKKSCLPSYSWGQSSCFPSVLKNENDTPQLLQLMLPFSWGHMH